MNREIKFRAWDKNKNKFIPTNTWAIVQTDFKAFGVMLKDWEDYKEGEYFYSNSQELSQYTGLKDKNGKEIYEGDILKKHYGSSVKICSVAYHTERAMFIQQDGYNEPLYELPLNLIEIIGNIYQNPELLNQ